MTNIRLDPAPNQPDTDRAGHYYPRRFGIGQAVKYLTYDTLNDIDNFYGPESTSISVNILDEKAERLVS